MNYKSLKKIFGFFLSFSCLNVSITIVCVKTKLDCAKIRERIEKAKRKS